ncbi:hypothetical protein [Noviherbaspirillum autotrophicum]|uniref:Uncharacterized protein n=1 Tax=Noviherbaspirillum autotrophicum TaxID=709839 RepID=A0A0C2BG60_9BURK|nr:hypothetical protein [Noviherbaspirillum autotrophicum]KIF80230.1 hypothetical protein TSA66_04460 [Noviherbaspirillum autotrophicum]
MDVNHIIEPERQGLWIAATFIVALLALVLAFASLKRVNNLTYMTQTEALLLNKKIEDSKTQGGSAPAAAPAAPATSK